MDGLAGRPWPQIVEAWPEAQMNVEGLRGRILKAGDHWILFMAADLDVHVPEHRHGAQWGIVLDGTMELTIGGECNTYRRGDVHYIPAAVDHSAVLFAGWRGLYLFRRQSAGARE